MVASTNVHQVADISVDARLISAFQNEGLTSLNSEMVPARGFEPRTWQYKMAIDPKASTCLTRP